MTDRKQTRGARLGGASALALAAEADGGLPLEIVEAVAPAKESSGSAAPERGVEALRHVLSDVKSVLIYSHMNPDPDTIGAALGMRMIFEHFGKRCGLTYRGFVGRAENRQLLDLAAPEMRPARELDQSEYDAAFLVDAQPDYGFNPELDKLPILGVVDHHPILGSPPKTPWCDIRPDYGSTCTIVCEYLTELGLVPTPETATALFYGLKTDTQDLCRRNGPADVRAYEWLLHKVDRRLLSRIENPPLTRDYFDNVAAGVTRAIAYRSTVITELGTMSYPDMVAQIADSLIRLEGYQWAVCFGLHDQRIYFSVRASHPNRNAGDVVRAVLQGEGVGGGHDSMAAGRVQLLEESEETYQRVVTSLWLRFLTVLGEDASEGRRLVRDLPSPPRIQPVP